MSQVLQLPKEGEKVGSGVIKSFINTGGSAYVYKTWNEDLEIFRAVKVISPDASSDVRDRFKTEGRISSKLYHQNIVQCFSSGLTSSGLPYLEMEYVSGKSLADLVHEHGNLPVSVSLAITICLLDALHYAHTIKYSLYGKEYVGLVHRDLKPANIIITSDGNVKLMDFGIARPVDISLHTVANTVPGTVVYMSPETCTGSSVDFRSDIYQLGLCLYEMLCGSPAFTQPDLSSLLEAKSSNGFPPLETMVKGNIDHRVISFLNRCLHLDTNLRYQSSISCLSDLRSLYRVLSFPFNVNDLIQSFLCGKPIVLVSLKNVYNKKLVYVSFVLFLFFLVSTIFFIHYKKNFGNKVFSNFVSFSDTLKIASSPLMFQSESSSSALHVSIPSATTVSTLKKGKPVHIVGVSPPKLDTSDAQVFISRGKKHYDAGVMDSAVANFQTAIKMPSKKSRQYVVQSCVYWLAKCNTRLYKEGLVPVSNYLVSWQAVQNAFPSSSPEYLEATSHLQEGSN